MRHALLAAIALCSAALLGLTPPRALATSPSDAPDASGRKEASAQQGAARQARPQSDQTPRTNPQPPGKRALAARPLDLSAPPISHVMTREQVQALIAEPDDSAPEDVMVEENRYQAPVPRGQIQALTWALVHPLQAWRIFTPVTDE